MILTETQLKILQATPARFATPMGPNAIGIQIWNRYRGSNCSAPYARIAGKALRSLQAFGLVERHPESMHWYRTFKGDEYLLNLDTAM